MGLHERLKTETSQLHKRLEELMHVDQIMQRQLGLAHYQQILRTNYLIHKQYEEAIFSALPANVANTLNLPSRLKLKALQNDLDQVKLMVDVQPTAADQRIIENAYTALGAMYVLEGATLGGNVIYKKLMANPNFEGSGLDFFYYKVYGDQLIPNWQSFVSVLNSIPEAHHNDVVKGAGLMFEQIALVAEDQGR